MAELLRMFWAVLAAVERHPPTSEWKSVEIQAALMEAWCFRYIHSQA
jgi:hypothetical protein